MCPFSGKTGNFDFFGPNLPKNGFRVGNSENQCWNKNDFLEILYVPIFRQNGQISLFWHKFAQKWILGLEFQKSKCEFGISTSKITCVPMFRQQTSLNFFTYILGNCPIKCDILVLIMSRVLERSW